MLLRSDTITYFGHLYFSVYKIQTLIQSDLPLGHHLRHGFYLRIAKKIANPKGTLLDSELKRMQVNNISVRVGNCNWHASSLVAAFSYCKIICIIFKRRCSPPNMSRAKCSCKGACRRLMASAKRLACMDTCERSLHDTWKLKRVENKLSANECNLKYVCARHMITDFSKQYIYSHQHEPKLSQRALPA